MNECSEHPGTPNKTRMYHHHRSEYYLLVVLSWGFKNAPPPRSVASVAFDVAAEAIAPESIAAEGVGDVVSIVAGGRAARSRVRACWIPPTLCCWCSWAFLW